MEEKKEKTESKSLSKKQRFEVFKRDKFTCQYCGRQAPDVVLEIDHIEPLYEGGKNDIMNYVTACKECNSGKGKYKLSDDLIVKKQMNELQELQDRREQMGMMLKWREELTDFKNKQIDMIAEVIADMSDNEFSLSNEEKSRLKQWIAKFGFDLVYESAEISYGQYYHFPLSFHEKCEQYCHAFNKIGGICYNKKYRQNESYY